MIGFILAIITILIFKIVMELHSLNKIVRRVGLEVEGFIEQQDYIRLKETIKLSKERNKNRNKNKREGSINE